MIRAGTERDEGRQSRSLGVAGKEGSTQYPCLSGEEEEHLGEKLAHTKAGGAPGARIQAFGRNDGLSRHSEGGGLGRREGPAVWGLGQVHLVILLRGSCQIF